MQPALVLREGTGTKGFSIHLKMWCTNCESCVSEGYTSPRTSTFHEVNRKAEASCVGSGIGLAGLNKICEGMGIRGLCKKVYQSHLNAAFQTSEEVSGLYLRQARDVVFQYYRINKPEAFKEDGILEIPVSFDGTWFKRGHTSKLGSGAVIDLATGLVIDFHVMSLYCQICCTTGEKRRLEGPEVYQEWLQKHKESGLCSQNYMGSSGGMEVEGALILWRRSQSHGMRYTTLLGDGDTKTFLALSRERPYGDVLITKEECVNHVAKRLGTGLRNLKSSLAKKNMSIGGKKKGSLTDTKIGLLQLYYTKAVRTSNTSVQEMSRAIGAGYYHSISTDDNPQHQFCPTGLESWCWYNRELAEWSNQPKGRGCNHSTFLNENVGNQVKEVYERLSNPELLSRCLLGKTQNTNESLHSVIWARCPKHVWFGYKRVFIATTLAVGEFNMGAAAYHQFLSSLGFQLSESCKILGAKRDKRRVQDADSAQLNVVKRRKESRRLASLNFQKAMEKAEGGASYSAGKF